MCSRFLFQDDVSLTVEEKYDLKLKLDNTIDDAEASAKFIKKTSTLVVNMPLKTS